MAKPTADTKWAASATKTEPSSGQKDAGWVVGQKPPAQWHNWWQDAVDQWVKWLSAFESTAHTWTALQTFQLGLIVTQSTSNSPGVHPTGNGNGDGVWGTGGTNG